MPDASDTELMRDYGRQGSEEAFAGLVQRHLNLVYSVALRHAGITAHAEEITQAVFIILARKAASLGPNIILAGWLHETTRLTALRFLRGERRRQFREQEAYMQSTLQETADDPAWNQLAPLLDEALSCLGKKDRDAVMLRFFKENSMREVATALRVNEAAAQRRVHRAVEKMRRFFTKRGVVLPAGVLTATISANSVQAAPVALAKAVTAMAITKGAAAGGSTLTLIKGALKLMAWTKAKTAVAAGAVILLTAGVATVAVKTVHAHRTQPNIRGAWEGIIAPQAGGKLRVVLHVSGANGSYGATIDSIDQRAKGIPVSKFAYDYPSLRFESEAVKGSFEGKLNPGADTMSGTWKQAGFTTPVVMKRTATPTAIPELLAESDFATRAGSDLQGCWKGTLNAGGVALRLAFKIAEPADGSFVGEVDSIDQGANSLVVSSITYDKPAVQMEVGAVGGVFEGKVNSDGTEITGTWTQGVSVLPLAIKRTDPKAEQAAEKAEAAAREANKDYSHAGANDLTGHWKGALDVQGMKLHLVLHVARLPNGDLSGSLDSIDQGANSIPADEVRFAAPNAHLEWKTIGGTYDGKVNNGKISGTWRQGGQSFPLVFARSAAD
jgi:RNA polymerase sigma factor (sigma-70 family)